MYACLVACMHMHVCNNMVASPVPTRSFGRAAVVEKALPESRPIDWVSHLGMSFLPGHPPEKQGYPVVSLVSFKAIEKGYPEHSHLDATFTSLDGIPTTTVSFGHSHTPTH